VVQQNAANAEESASASEEMKAQAEYMKESVNELILLVSGSKGNGAARSNASVGRKISEKEVMSTSSKALPVSVKTRHGRAQRSNGNDVAYYKKREVSPSQVIPFDDEELGEF